MEMWQAASLVEHPGHPDQKAHGGKSKAYMASFQKVTEPISGKTRTAALTIHRKDKAGVKWSRTYRGKSAERGYERVNKLARGGDPKSILKRTPPQSWGDVRSGHTFTYGFERRAGK